METKHAFLVVEDNEIDQLITTKMLKKMADVSEISIANNGREGIEWVCDNRKKINGTLIILLDIMMPIMNGFQFLIEYEKLEDELKRETKIFMLSSALCPDEVKIFKENIYVADFLGKPFCVTEFSKRLYTNFYN